MEEESYLYNGKVFTYSTLKEKYGEKTDDVIKSQGFEKAYEFNGKVFGQNTLVEKYGDDFQKVAEENGITPYIVKKNNAPSGPDAGSTSEEEPFSFSEEIASTWNNIVENTKTLDDRAQLLLNRMAEPIENAVFGDKANAIRLASNMTALEELDKSSQKLKPTQSISDAIASRSPERIAAGVVTSVMQLGESVAKTAASGGLYPFIEGPTSLYYQTLQETANDSQEKPLSVILNNEDKVAIPAIGGVISGAIEKIGLDKVTKRILSKAPMGFWKKITDVGVTAGVEGTTEAMQSVIEQVSVQIANGKDIDIAWKEVLDSGLVGAIGGGAISGTSNAIKSIKRKPNESGPDNTQDGTEAATNQVAQPEDGVTAPTGDLGVITDNTENTTEEAVQSTQEEGANQAITEQSNQDVPVNNITESQVTNEEVTTQEIEAPQNVLKNEDGSYTVKNTKNQYNVKVSEGRLKITNEKGVEPSKKTIAKVTKQYRDELDFTEGEFAPDPGDQSVDNPSRYIAETSNNSSEIAQQWQNENEYKGDGLSYKEKFIADNIGDIIKSDFIDTSSKADVARQVSLSYFAKIENEDKVSRIDQMAEDWSETAKVEITPQDIVDFMLDFPNGPKSARRSSPDAAVLESKFQSLTGLPLNQENADIAKAQSQFKQLEESKATILAEEGVTMQNLETFKDEVADQNYTQEEYEELARIIENEERGSESTEVQEADGSSQGKRKKQVNSDKLRKATETGEVKPAQYAQRIMADPNTTSWMKEEADKNGNYKEVSQDKANIEADKLISSFKKEYGIKDGLRAAKDLLINNTSQIPPIMRGTLGAKISVDMQLQDMRSEGVELAKFQTERGTGLGQEMVGRKANASPEQVVSSALTKLDQRNQEKLEAAKTKNDVPYMQAIEALQNDLRNVKEDFEAFKKSQPKTTPKSKPVTGQALIKKAKEKRKAGLDLINKSLKGNRDQLNSGIPLDSDLFKGLKQVFESYLLETRGNFQVAFDRLKKDVKGKLPKEITLEDYQEALNEGNQEVIDEITRDEQVQLIKQFIKSTRKSKGEINDAKIKDIEALVDEFNQTGEISSDAIYEFAPETAGIETIDSKTRKEILTETRAISELTAEGKQIEAAKRYEDLQNRLLDLDIDKQSVQDLIYDLWYTNTLSGLTTINRSVLGSSLTVFMTNTTRALTNPRIAPLALKEMLKSFSEAPSIYAKVMRTGDAAVEFRDYKQNKPSYLKKVVNKNFSELNAKDKAAKAFFSLPVYMFRNILAADAVLTFASSDFNYTIREYNDIIETDKTRKNIYNKVRERRADGKTKAAKEQAQQEYEQIKKDNPKLAKELGKSYPTLRAREIIDQARNQETVKKSLIDAKESALVSSPKGFLGRAYKAFDTFLAPEQATDEDSKAAINTAKMIGRLTTFPFLRVFFNYMNMSLQYTPVGVVKALPLKMNKTIWTKDGMQPVTKMERQEMAVRSAIGTTLAIAVYASVFGRDDEDNLILNEDSWIKVSGNMTGNWKDEKKTDGERKPWSVAFKLPDGSYTRYFSYLDNPIGLMLAPLGIMSDEVLYGNFQDEVKGNKAKKVEQSAFWLTSQFMLGAYRYAMDQSFNQGLRNIEEILSPKSSDASTTGERIAKVFVRPAGNLIMPSAYKQLHNQYKAYQDIPEKESQEWYASAIKNVPFAEAVFQDDKVDVFGYPIVRDFDFPLLPDFLLKTVKENLDYRDGLKEWQLLRKYPQVIVSNFDLPKSINKDYNIDEEKRTEFIEKAGLYFRQEVNSNYTRLDEMDAVELQKELNYYKTKSYNYAKNNTKLIKK